MQLKMKKSILLLLIFLKTESEISKEKIEETNEFYWNDDRKKCQKIALSNKK